MSSSRMGPVAQAYRVEVAGDTLAIVPVGLMSCSAIHEPAVVVRDLRAGASFAFIRQDEVVREDLQKLWVGEA